MMHYYLVDNVMPLREYRSSAVLFCGQCIAMGFGLYNIDLPTVDVMEYRCNEVSSLAFV